MDKFIILNRTTGKPVQSWTFAWKRHVMYCSSPEWALKFESGDAARRQIAFLKRNFPGQDLVPMRMKLETVVTLG